MCIIHVYGEMLVDEALAFKAHYFSSCLLLGPRQLTSSKYT